MKTIAELWGSISRQADNLYDRERRLSSAEFFDKDGRFDTRDEFLENCDALKKLPGEISQINGYIQSLRAELLERCGNDLEMTILKTEFHGWAIRYDTSYIDKFYTKERALKIAAAMQFMAWELEQREKEGKDEQPAA